MGGEGEREVRERGREGREVEMEEGREKEGEGMRERDARGALAAPALPIWIFLA